MVRVPESNHRRINQIKNRWVASSFQSQVPEARSVADVVSGIVEVVQAK